MMYVLLQKSQIILGIYTDFSLYLISLKINRILVFTGGVVKTDGNNCQHKQFGNNVFVRIIANIGYNSQHIPKSNNVKSCTIWNSIMLMLMVIKDLM